MRYGICPLGHELNFPASYENENTYYNGGEQDNFAPVELGHQLEKLLPNFKFQNVSNAGHQVQNNQPELISKLMIKFFS